MKGFITIVVCLLGIMVVLIALFMLVFHQSDRSVAELSKRWAQAPSQFIEVNGMQIHLRDEGPKSDATPLVLLHGTSASLHTWDGWVLHLQSLLQGASRKNRRVIRFDMPAFGLTGPDPENDYCIENYAKTVVAVMDALNVERAIVAGNSLGGYVAWATAVLYPERVNKLILIDASGLAFKSKSTPLGFKIARNPILNGLLGNTLPRFLIQRSVENVYSDRSKVSSDIVDRYFELTLRQGNRDALAQRFLQTQPGLLANRISEISQPTMILWGLDDNLIPLDLGYQFKQLIPNSRLKIFDNLGHIPHEEGPRETVSSILSFIDE
tara:strand:- start:3291 stop:4262 length:972 start_codon:yes stop_codon:yes gene_type:complete